MKHSKTLKRIAALLVLGALLAAAAGARAAESPVPPVPVNLLDVLGKPVHVAAASTPTVLIFMSRAAKDGSAAFARAIDERLLDKPVESVGIVDVRKYGGILRNIATSYLKRSAEEAKLHRRERREARGVDASPAAVERWHLVGDFDGSLFARFGVAAEPKQPLAFVVDRAGKLQGPFSDVDRVVAAVTQ